MSGDATAASHDGVMAVVLTYDAPNAAHACIGAILGQTAPVASILVVDNASEPPFAPGPPAVFSASAASAPSDAAGESRVAGASHASVDVLRLPDNVGPAGGYAAGLRAFLASDHAWVWLVDDDAMPRTDALAIQLHAAEHSAVPTAYLATMLDRDTGRVANTHGWCGVLVPRAVVAAVGMPMEELFWWSEDTEYLQWRIPRAGFGLERCDDAIVEVSLRRPARAKPAWKFYYETRNQVFFRVHVQRQPESGPPQRHLRARVRWWRAGRSFVKLAARAALREPDGRGAKLAMVVRGARDGLASRLGRTVPVDRSDRPLPPTAAGSGRGTDAEELLDLDQA